MRVTAPTDLDSLAEKVVTMTSEARMLRHEVNNQRKRVWLLAIIFVALLIPSAVSVAGYVRQGAALQQLRDTAKTNERNGRILVECTSPGPDKPTEKNQFRTGHDCYDNGQAQTGKAVKEIVCAVNPEVEGC